jgi:hypothetical protein
MRRAHEENLWIPGQNTFSGVLKIYHNEIGWEGVDWINLAQDRDRWRPLVITIMEPLNSINGENFCWTTISLWRTPLLGISMQYDIVSTYVNLCRHLKAVVNESCNSFEIVFFCCCFSPGKSLDFPVLSGKCRDGNLECGNFLQHRPSPLIVLLMLRDTLWKFVVKVRNSPSKSLKRKHRLMEDSETYLNNSFWCLY